jgi:hypothetical protein
MASVAQVRTQFTNVSTGTNDLNKQNTKYAKFKKEIMDAGKFKRKGWENDNNNKVLRIRWVLD